MVHEGSMHETWTLFTSVSSSPCVWLNPLSCCAAGSLHVFGWVFWGVSHRLLRIHSLGLASLVSMQHPMGSGLIHSLQGNGGGTVMPK